MSWHAAAFYLQRPAFKDKSERESAKFSSIFDARKDSSGVSVAVKLVQHF